MKSYEEVAKTFEFEFIDEEERRTPTDADLLRLEKSLGHELPPEFRAFLTQYSGGSYCEPVVAPLQEPASPDETRISLNVFFGFYKKSDGEFHEYDIRGNLQDYRDRMPRHILPVGDDPGGNLICLSCGTGDRGRVYFWDHEEEPEEGTVPGYSNMALLANDFPTFICNLERDPNYE